MHSIAPFIKDVPSGVYTTPLIAFKRHIYNQNVLATAVASPPRCRAREETLGQMTGIHNQSGLSEEGRHTLLWEHRTKTDWAPR